MQNTFIFENKEYIFARYPRTENRSLKSWNAADEHILRHLDALDRKPESIFICNDRFGFLTCLLYRLSPKIIVNYSSQKKAILQNLEANQVSTENLRFIEPLEVLSRKIDVGLLKIPKSMELFRLQLIQISKSLSENATVLCGFMTKYFTPQIIEVAEELFEKVEQSKAWKKSRVLILRDMKPLKEHNIVNLISFEEQVFKQYFGVFSSKHIDDASQFFIKHMTVENDAKKVLDLGSGNGFLAKVVRLRNPDCEIHLLDDDWLAVESSRLNFPQNDENTFFHFSDSLDLFEDDVFDLVVCNPPFHFENETNIEVAIQLFKEVKRCVKTSGNFQLVANRHLNYKTHLIRSFEKVETVKRNKKFEIYKCETPR